MTREFSIVLLSMSYKHGRLREPVVMTEENNTSSAALLGAILMQSDHVGEKKRKVEPVRNAFFKDTSFTLKASTLLIP